MSFHVVPTFLGPLNLNKTRLVILGRLESALRRERDEMAMRHTELMQELHMFGRPRESGQCKWEALGIRRCPKMQSLTGVSIWFRRVSCSLAKQGSRFQWIFLVDAH